MRAHVCVNIFLSSKKQHGVSYSRTKKGMGRARKPCVAMIPGFGLLKEKRYGASPKTVYSNDPGGSGALPSMAPCARSGRDWVKSMCESTENM